MPSNSEDLLRLASIRRFPPSKPDVDSSTRPCLSIWLHASQYCLLINDLAAYATSSSATAQSQVSTHGQLRQLAIENRHPSKDPFWEFVQLLPLQNDVNLHAEM